MNLRGIANVVARQVNPNVAITVNTSTGYTIDPATRRQIPTYVSTNGYGNLQALDGQDLKQLAGLNLQGEIKALFLYGDVAGAIRPDNRGGDTVTIGGKTWLVVKVLEGWMSGAAWAKVAVQYQGNS